ASLVGTESNETIPPPNGEAGVGVLNAPGNVIGGTATGTRNVLSGQNRAGVFITGNSASGNQVLGNFIGTDRTGLLALGSLFNGVLIIDAPRNTIGGTSVSARNVIAGNGQ